MKRRIPRYIMIPAILIIYLGVMSYIGYPYYKSGLYSATYYFGIIGASLVIDVLLFFFLRKRDRLRQASEADLKSK